MTTKPIYMPLSIWMQFASLFFTLSGVHGDLLIIRLFLFAAYLMILINSLLGSPLWGDKKADGLPLDSLIWAVVGLYVHGTSLANLLNDERDVALNENEEALWHLFYRTGGLSRCLFKTVIAPDMEFVTLAEDEDIPTDQYFYIIYHGRVRLKIYDGSSKELKVDRILGSAEMFDIAHVGFFDNSSVFVKVNLRCRTMEKTQFFRFSRSAIRKIANHQFAKDVMQALLLNSLSKIVEHRETKRDSAVLCDPIFSPLHAREQPIAVMAGSGKALQKPLLHIVSCIRRSFSLPWPLGKHPAGIRQVLLSPPGQRVRNPKASSTAPTTFHSCEDNV